MSVLNYIKITCLGQQTVVPVNLDIVNVIGIQAIFNGIASEFGELGYSLVKGNPSFIYNGYCDVIIAIDEVTVRVEKEDNGSGKIKCFRREDFVVVAALVWEKIIVVDEILEVSDCNLGLNLYFEVQEVVDLANSYQEISGASEYDVVIQKNLEKMRVFINPAVYGDVEAMKIQILTSYT